MRIIFKINKIISIFSELNKRKEAILKALEIKANAVLDMHLKQSKLKIPSTFRSGLQFKIEDSPTRESTPAAQETKDEGIAVEVKYFMETAYSLCF